MADLSQKVITAERFEVDYAALVETTVDQLHTAGREAVPCFCDWEGCRGWVLGYMVEVSGFRGVYNTDRHEG